MVNSNNYPVEIPKTYTVSYFNETEWNKDLTPQEVAQQELINVSYQDEIVAQEQGYGPCKVCNKPTQWTELYVSCPAVGCPRGNMGSPSSWYHRGCGGYAKVSNKARIECSKCGLDRHMSAWNFSCSAHTGTTDESVSYGSFNKSLGWVLQNLDRGPVIRDLGIYVGWHDEEWPN